MLSVLLGTVPLGIHTALPPDEIDVSRALSNALERLMPDTVSDFVWSRLHQWGVRRVYGYPGDGIGGLISALQRREKDIEFIQARHEEMASLMASRETRFTGKVAVCIATSGPGAVHLLNGLYDARLDHRPVVALVGQQARSAIGSHYQQDLDLQSLFKDVAGAYVETASVPAQVPHLIDRAFRIAQAAEIARQHYPWSELRRDDLIWALWRRPTHDELIKAWPARHQPAADDFAQGWWQPTLSELRDARRAARSLERALETRKQGRSAPGKGARDRSP